MFRTAEVNPVKVSDAWSSPEALQHATMLNKYYIERFVDEIGTVSRLRPRIYSESCAFCAQVLTYANLANFRMRYVWPAPEARP